MVMNTKSNTRADEKAEARDELIYHLTEDLLVLMEDRGITKSGLARALGKSRAFVTQILSGKRNMTLGTLSDICYELKVNPYIQVLPNGGKVVKYEDDLEWHHVNHPQAVNYSSDKVVSIFSRANEIEYQEFRETGT